MSVNEVQIELIRKLLRHGDRERVAKALDKFRAAELADLFGHLPNAERKTFIQILVDVNQAAETLSELPDQILQEIFEHIDSDLIAIILSRMPSDDAAAAIGMMSEELQNLVLSKLETKLKERIEHIRNYPKNSAGSIMSGEMLTLPQNLSAQEAIEGIRVLAHSSEFIFYIYVVNENGTFVGVVPLRRLISAPPESHLKEVMVIDPIAVLANEDQEKVAEIVARYDLLAVPVVDEQFLLLGVITVDDVIDVMRAEATEDMYLMQGLSEEDRVYSPISVSIRKRFPWMVLNLFSVFVTAAVVGLFERSIAEVVILATFMPVVAGMGGNSGTQTLTVVTRGIALGELAFSDAKSAIFKQLIVGFVIGLGIGVITGLAAWLWKGNPMLGLLLFIAMMINMSVAGLTGAAVPILLKTIRQDPALGGGVIVTTFTDIVGFFAFLSLATLFLEYLK